jgi:hypothetical protein
MYVFLEVDEIFLGNIFIIFFGLPMQQTPKNAIKALRKKRYWIFLVKEVIFFRCGALASFFGFMP